MQKTSGQSNAKWEWQGAAHLVEVAVNGIPGVQHDGRIELGIHRLHWGPRLLPGKRGADGPRRASPAQNGWTVPATQRETSAAGHRPLAASAREAGSGMAITPEMGGAFSVSVPSSSNPIRR
jgi:hypothetical protein